jgi:hypothetical protein
MLKIITSLTLFVTGMLANVQSETRTVSSFNKLEITDGVEIIFTQSDNYSVRAEASDGLGLSTLLTESKNNTLKISCNGNLNETVRVYVSAPEIISVKAGKNSKIVFTDQLSTNTFDLSLASGATFNGSVKSAGETVLRGKSGSVFNIRLETGALAANFQSGAKVNLSGTSGKTSIRTSDNSLCSARNFRAGKAHVKATGNSSVIISVKEEIAVDVNDDATVKYFGFPGKTSVNPEAVAVSVGNMKSLITQN